MKNQRLRFLVTAAVLCLPPSPCLAQSLLNQNNDELLKGFDVDPAYLNQYQRKQSNSGNKGLLQSLIETAGSLVSIERSSVDSSIRLKVPFVSVKVDDGLKGVKVKAPFLTVDSASGLSLNKPFTSVNQQINQAPNSETVPLRDSKESKAIDEHTNIDAQP